MVFWARFRSSMSSAIRRINGFVRFRQSVISRVPVFPSLKNGLADIGPPREHSMRSASPLAQPPTIGIIVMTGPLSQEPRATRAVGSLGLRETPHRPETIHGG